MGALMNAVWWEKPFAAKNRCQSYRYSYLLPSQGGQQRLLGDDGGQVFLVGQAKPWVEIDAPSRATQLFFDGIVVSSANDCKAILGNGVFRPLPACPAGEGVRRLANVSPVKHSTPAGLSGR
jgi:hypothetical protein